MFGGASALVAAFGQRHLEHGAIESSTQLCMDMLVAARQAFAQFKAQREAMEEFKAWMSTDKAARDSTAQLVALLDNANKDVVLGAVRSLATLKAKTALPALVKLLEKNDPDVKKAVQDAIGKIGE